MNLQIIPERAYYKTRNAGTRNNRTRNTGGTAEHHRTVGEQRNTPEHQWDNNVTPAEHPGIMKQYKTKKNCSVYKENLNLTLIHLALSIQG